MTRKDLYFMTSFQSPKNLRQIMSVKSPLRQKRKLKVSRSFDLSLSSSIDEKITHQRESLSLFPVGPTQSKHEDPLFEQILLLGARPMSEFIIEAPAEILLAYPSGRIQFTDGESHECVQGYTDIPLFCFPDGFREPENQSIDHIVEQFVMIVGEKYCVCTIFHVPEDIETFFCNAHSRRYPFCLCMVTSSLNLSVQFKYMSFIVASFVGHRNYVTKNDVEPLIMNEFDIPGLVSEHGIQKMKDMSVPLEFINELCWIHNVRPIDGEILSIPLGDDFLLEFPDRDTMTENVALATMDTLFSVLSVERILKCVSLMLLGEKLLFLSNNKHIVSMCLLCLRELLLPYKYPFAFRPVLPSVPEFIALLDAPHPYAYGFLKPFNGLESDPKDTDYFIVDLDKNHIFEPRHVLMIPKAQSLESRLKKLRKSAKKLSPPSKPKSFAQIRSSSYGKSVIKRLTPSHVEEFYWLNRRKYIFERNLVKDIILNIRSYIVPDLETHLKPCFITDTTDINHAVTIFNNDLFLYGIEDYAKPFFKEFVQTPIWVAFQTQCTEENAHSVGDGMKDLLPLGRRRSGSKSVATFNLTDS